MDDPTASAPQRIYELMKEYWKEAPEVPIRVKLIQLAFKHFGNLDLGDLYPASPIFSEVRVIFEANGEEDLTRYLVTEDEYSEWAKQFEWVTWAPPGDMEIKDPAEERRKGHEFFKAKKERGEM